MLILKGVYMKKIIKVIVVTLALTGLFSCASLNAPVAATSNPVGELVGQSTGTIWLGLIGNVDASIKEAAQNGGITEISTVDFEYKMVALGFGAQFTCTVTGN